LTAQERWNFDALLVSIWLLLRLRTAHLWLHTRLPQQGVALAVAQPLVERLASALAHDPSYG
jgi:hypothetical protein